MGVSRRRVEAAEAPIVGDLAVAGDQRDRAGNVAAGDAVLQGGGQAVERGLAEANFLRLCGRQGFGHPDCPSGERNRQYGRKGGGIKVYVQRC